MLAYSDVRKYGSVSISAPFGSLCPISSGFLAYASKLNKAASLALLIDSLKSIIKS
jgi:hypothetical protein